MAGPTIAQLRQMAHVRHCYLLLIEGVPWAFSDEPALAAAGWWTEDEREIKLGLTVPESLKISLDTEDWILTEEQATFRLLDLDSTVPQFFGGLSKAFKGLGARLSPLDSPAPATIDQYGNALVLDSAYVGTEAIGSGGERNYYSCTPVWGPMPGQDHPSEDAPLPVVTDASTGPLLVEGRRVALYRLIYNPTTGDWPSFTDQVNAATEGGWSPMLWWGTLRQAGKVDGRIWSITCTGPGSWLRKALNARTTTEWYPVTADFSLEDNEKHIGIECTKRYYADGATYHFGLDHKNYDVDPSTPDTVVSSIQTAIAATIAAAGDDGIWTDSGGIGGGEIDFDADHIQISSSKNLGYQMILKLILGRKVWRALGYDPDAGIGNDEGPGPRFSPGAPPAFAAANPDVWVDPPPSYYSALLTTCPFGTSPIGFTGDVAWAGSDKPKTYHPLYEAGVSVLSGKGQQVVHLTPEDNASIYCESQTIRARENATEINGISCNAGGWWCFRGKLQLPQGDLKEQPEPVDTVQVARCYWVESDPGVILADEGGITRGLFIDHWLDPRLFGLHYEPLDPALGWASNDGGERIEASPLRVLGAFERRPDRIDWTLTRILTSTGMGVWDGGTEDVDDDGAKGNATSFLTQGDNTLGLSWPAGDYEIFDLGLQIPAPMIDLASIQAAADDLPNGAGGALGQSKICIQGGPIQSEELIKAIMAPRGWALSLCKGKIGLWSPHINPEVAYDELGGFEIGESDLHGTAGDPASVIPSVELRPVYPYERVAWTHTGDPTASWIEGQEELKYKARDPGSRARSGARTREVAAPDLLATQWFVEGDQLNPNNADTKQIKGWSGDVTKLWEIDIPTWLAQPHRLIQGLRISRPKGQDIYPGAILKLTNPWPANSVGGYGVTGYFARVLSVTHETDSCACVLDAIIYAQAPGALRWAPVVRVLDDAATPSDRYDSATKTFYLEDWGGYCPVAWFIKPDFVAADDAPACIWILQFDGVTWERTGIAFVDSIDATAKTMTLTSDGITGTFYERMYTLICLAPSDYEDQVAWVRALYPIHTLSTNPSDEPALPL